MTDTATVKAALRAQRIETPSWAYGNSGTRFKVFAQEGVPRNAYEKVDDAATVHRFTGVAPSVALHIPWDRVDDYADLAKHAGDAGIADRRDQPERLPGRRLQARQRLQPRPGASAARRMDHLLECVEIRTRTGSTILKLWFADGTNYPGQDDIRGPSGPAGRGARARRTPRLGPRSGCCWSTSSSSRRSTRRTFPTGDRRTRTACALGDRAAGARRHRPPRAGHQHRVHRGAAAARRAARRLRLQLPLLRRRRPDGRRRRPVPAVPDHARDRAGRRAATPARTWRSCSTSATTSSRRSRP